MVSTTSLTLPWWAWALGGCEVQPKEPDPAARFDAPVERGTWCLCRAENPPGDASQDMKGFGELGRMRQRGRAAPRPRHLHPEVVGEEL
jgi:hypothetical protein